MKCRKGFTLLEMVISIAALSLLSMFIVQMFMTSANVNERARNADIALMMAVSEIDRIKAAAPADIHAGTVVTHLDRDWNAVPAHGGGTRFRMTVIINHLPDTPGLHEIGVIIDEYASGGDPLVSLTAKKYLSPSESNR